MAAEPPLPTPGRAAALARRDATMCAAPCAMPSPISVPTTPGCVVLVGLDGWCGVVGSWDEKEGDL